MSNRDVSLTIQAQIKQEQMAQLAGFRDRVRDLQESLKEGQAVYAKTRTDHERHASDIARLGKLYKAGALDADTYRRAVRKLQEDMRAASPAYQAQLAAQKAQAAQMLAAAKAADALRARRATTALADVAAMRGQGGSPGAGLINSLAAVPAMRFGGGVGAIGGLVGAGAAAGAVGFSVKAAADFEQTNVAFQTMLKSGDEAKRLLADIQGFAAATPFQFTELTDASKKLLAFGVNAKDIVPTLRRIGDVSSGIGAPIGEIAELYGKAKVQGRLFAQDINQLTGRGIPIIQELAKQFGVTEDSVRQLVETGQVDFKNLDQAFKNMTGDGGQFAGLMAAQSETLAGKFSNLKDNIGALAREWGGKLIPVLKVHVDMLNFALGQDMAHVPGLKGARAFNDVYQGADRKPATEFLNLGNAIDAGKEALKTEKDPVRRAMLQKQVAEAEARRKQVGEEFRASAPANKAARERYGAILGGGLVGGLGSASSGLTGLLGGALGATRGGAESGLDALTKFKGQVALKRQLIEQTRTPKEKFDAELAKLDANRGVLGDDLYNRRRAQLQAQFDKSLPKEKVEKEEKFKPERRALAPLTEARFLTAAPGYAADPAALAKQQANDTKESKEVQKQQLVVLRAMERKLQRQARLGAL